MSILIAEDNPRDSLDIASAAQQWGMTVRVETFTELMAALEKGQRFDLLILDLKLGSSDPRNTVQAVRMATSNLRLPVIVVTGYPDEDLKRDCETFGWRWIDKDSQRFKAKLYQAIDKAINAEDSGARHAKESGQLDAILSTLQEVRQQVAELTSKMDVIFDQMYGPQDPRTGYRCGGCIQRQEKAMQVVTLGGAWLWAAYLGTAGAVASLVSWVFSKVTQ
jgi:CheY-like chemotaxis protein